MNSDSQVLGSILLLGSSLHLRGNTNKENFILASRSRGVSLVISDVESIRCGLQFTSERKCQQGEFYFGEQESRSFTCSIGCRKHQLWASARVRKETVIAVASAKDTWYGLLSGLSFANSKWPARAMRRKLLRNLYKRLKGTCCNRDLVHLTKILLLRFRGVVLTDVLQRIRMPLEPQNYFWALFVTVTS